MSMPGLRTNWSVKEWQNHLATLYAGQNAQRRPLETFARVVEMASGMARGIREDDKEGVQKFASRTLAWVLGLATQMNVDLEACLWAAYPGVCTHCKQVEACVCRLKPKLPRLTAAERTAFQSTHKLPSSMVEWQAMFNRIYGNVNRMLGTDKSVLHFLEELGEVSEAVRFAIAPDSPFDKLVSQQMVKDELADLFAWFCGLVNLKAIEVDHFMMRTYSDSCPECLTKPCKCDPYHVHSRIRLGGKGK